MSDERLIELLSAIYRHERQVLDLLVTYPRTARPIVEAAGLSVEHFEGEDHRLIFSGWQVACEQDLSKLDTLRLIRRALVEDGFWGPATPGGCTGLRHSDFTLARLATAPMTQAERAELIGLGPGDGLRRTITRHVVALVDAAETMRRVAA